MTELLGRVEAPDLHVATWNIRRRIEPTWPPADRWRNRAPRLAALLQADPPHVLCVQEALPDQAHLVWTALGERYRRVGHGRGREGRGEGCPVFYDRTRLELLESEQLALSDTPHRAGSTSWGNITPRVLVRLVLRDRPTGSVFEVVNTHLDVFSARSRVRSAVELRRLAASARHPVIVAGDMNATPRSTAMTELFAGGVLVDAWRSADERRSAEWDTFAGYRRPRRRRGRIDLIAVTPDVSVPRIAIDTREVDGAHPSDHLCVRAVVRISGAAS